MNIANNTIAIRFLIVYNRFVLVKTRCLSSGSEVGQCVARVGVWCSDLCLCLTLWGIWYCQGAHRQL